MENSKAKNITRILVISGLVMILVLITARLLLKTKWALNKAKEVAEEQLTELSGVEVSIANLEGDLWKTIQISGVSVDEMDSLLFIDSINVRYNALGFLRKTAIIHSLTMDGIQGNINQEKIAQFSASEANTGEEESSSSFKVVMEEVLISNANMELYFPEYLPDSTLIISGFELSAGFELDDDYAFDLNTLSFSIEEGRLPEPIKIQANANGSGDEITLNELVIETGRSMLKTQAATNLTDSSITAGVSTLPISLADISPYLDTDLPSESMEMSLSVLGNADSLRFELNLDHPVAPNLFATTGVQLDSIPSLSHFGIMGEGLDIASFTNDSIPLVLGDYRISFNGKLSSEIQNADIIWGYTFNQIQFKEYYIDRFIGAGTVVGDSLVGYLDVNPHFEDGATAYPLIRGISTEQPFWSVDIGIGALNAKDWVDDVDIETYLNLSIELEGTGFELNEEDWKYSIKSFSRPELVGYQEDSNGIPVPIMNYTRNHINNQELEPFELKGTINENLASLEGYVQVLESKIDIQADVNDFLSDEPSYSYSLSTVDFDASEINALTEFPTSINLNIEGIGTGFNPDECTIDGNIVLEGSEINGAYINLFNTRIQVDEGIFQISDGLLISELADGAINGRRNITDISDPENRLSLDLIIKDPQALAGLTNFNKIDATGALTGEIFQDEAGLLTGAFELNLEQVQLDSLLYAEHIQGTTKIDFLAKKQFGVNVSVEEPVINSAVFQDIELILNGTADEDSMDAFFELDVIGSERGRLEQSGFIEANFIEEIMDIEFIEFDFITRSSELALQSPFHVKTVNEGFGTDTLTLKSETGAYANLGIPYFYEEEQAAFFEGQDFNFGLIQDIIFGERTVDGILSGGFNYERTNDQVTGAGAFSLQHFNYQETIIDTVQVSYSIENRRLSAQGKMFWDGLEMVTGEADVPFVINEDLLDEAFFAQPVNGSLIVQPTSLDRFEALLLDAGITETTGILAFNGLMSGTAGLPSFSGEMELAEPELSGIAVDTVLADFVYNNTSEELDITGEIFAQNEPVAIVDINYPLGYDFRDFELILPDEEDSLSINVFSSNLNLALFNDFLDENYIQNLQGRLTSEIAITGPLGLLTPTGYLTLENSQISVVYSGIELTEMNADVSFTSDQLVIHDISAESGDGDFRLNGIMELEGIYPTQMNVLAEASRFELFNTDDLKMVINMDSKVEGMAIRPKVTGMVELVNGYYYLAEFGEDLVEDVELDVAEEEGFAPFDSLEMDMTFLVERNFFVRSRDYLDLELEPEGELDIQKETGGELQLFGQLGSRQGYIRPLGKRFDMQTAELTFVGPADNPDMNIRSRYIPQSRQKGETVELFYVIEGNALEPIFRFESNPEMEQSDVICFTLFDQPCNLLESWQSVFAQGGSDAAAVNALTEVLLDQVENLATRQLGVDVVQIDNSGASGATAIKTGWYLNERTFFTIINEITSSTPKTLFMLEYILDENWDLVVTQGDDSRQGIELRFQFDY